MSRLLVTILVLIIVVVGGLYLLGSRAHERPTTHVEKAVTLGNLT